MAWGGNNQNLKEIRAWMDKFEFRFHEFCWQSQAELKIHWTTLYLEHIMCTYLKFLLIFTLKKIQNSMKHVYFIQS